MQNCDHNALFSDNKHVFKNIENAKNYVEKNSCEKC